jgi:hypothetical protein
MSAKAAVYRDCDPATCRCAGDIQNQKEQSVAMWESIKEIRIDNKKTLNRISVLLGSVALACILLAANLIFK